MSTAGQGSKARQELLDEYEKDYLTRLDNEKNQSSEPTKSSKSDTASSDLQNFMFQVTNESKKLEVKNYIANCAACKKPITKDELKYTKGREFHAECFELHGNEFEPMNYDFLNNSSRLKIELTQLKNLQSRSGGSTKKSTSSVAKPKQKTKRKTSKKKRTSQKKKRTKRKRKTKRRAKRKSSRRKTATRKRRPTRKTKRKTTRRKPKRRRAKRKIVRRRKRKARRRR